MAQQFQQGENVDAGNLAYLQGFSDSGRQSYDWLMDQVVDIYGLHREMQKQELRTLRHEQDVSVGLSLHK